MRTPISDLDTLQRDAQERRIGADLYTGCSNHLTTTVEAMSAAVSRVATRGIHGELVADGFGEAMMAEAAVKHLSSIERSPGDTVPRS